MAELTQALAEKGLAARIVESTTQPPFARVTSRETAQLSEKVGCGPGEDGELWFVYSWGDPIAPVRHVESAAERVRYILTPQGACGADS